MDYSRAIRALEKEKAVYERLLLYQVKSKVNYKKIIWELEEAIRLIQSRSQRREGHRWNY